jgi:hypothetical protein
MSQFAFDIQDFIEHRAEREFTFPLHASSIGRRGTFEVRCRRLNMMDRAAIGQLPSDLQNEVWTQLKAAAREINTLQEKGGEAKDINEALANNDKMLAVADLFCRYGWIEPSVVLTEREEHTAAGTLWIGRFAPEDRIAYMIGCQDADSEQARHFRTFRRSGAGADAVPHRQGGEVVPGAPERPAGYPAEPVQFQPPVSGG